MPEAIKNELAACQNMEQLFAVLAKHYDLKNAKIGPFAKIAILKNIPSIIMLVNAKLK